MNRHEKVTIGIALAAGLCIGGGLGYIWGKRAVRAETEAEIEGVKDLFRRLREEDASQARADWSESSVDSEEDSAGAFEESTEEATVINLGYAKGDDVWAARHQDPNYRPPEYPDAGDEDLPANDEIDPDLVREVEYLRNLTFVDPNSENNPHDVTKWDRSPDFPYVITEAEFRIDAPEHEKLSLTYYGGDQVLAEADGSYIPDLEGTVGSANLQYFGLASGDERVLHIRNERVMADFEVSLNDGIYSRDVLGYGTEDAGGVVSE